MKEPRESAEDDIVADRVDEILARFRNGETESVQDLFTVEDQISRCGVGLFSSLPWDVSLAEAQVRGSVIDNYEIVRRIGQGGMGVIYEALDRVSARRVALKILRIPSSSSESGAPTSRWAKLWLREVRALAKLEHPEIATLYRAGTSRQGLPFLAMELVEGKHLDTWVREQCLDVRNTLLIFQRLARAMDFAHNQGVIHLDLKPSNVLVEATGAIKVLDFGMAKLREADDATESGWTRDRNLSGTLPYLAPEQVDARVGPLDERTDVYALGLILYELLTGQRPYGVDRTRPLDAARTILTVTARSPSRIRAGLARDLDAIVGRALSKEQGARYNSAAELADDVERYLRNIPVRAHAPSLRYVASRFFRRHAWASLLALVASLAIIVGSLMIHHSRVESRRSRERAHASVVAIEEMFASMRPGASESVTMEVREYLDVVAKALFEESLAGSHTLVPSDPWIEAAKRGAIGRTYVENRLAEKGLPHLLRALELQRQLHMGAHPDLARSLRDLGFAWHACGSLDKAEALQREALAMRLQLFPPHHAAVRQSRIELIELLVARGQPAEARVLVEELAQCVRATPPASPRVRADQLTEAGKAWLDAQAHSKALPLLEAAWSLREDDRDCPDRHRMETLHQLARAYQNASDTPRALALFEELLAMQRKALGQGDPQFLRTLVAVGNLQRLTGKANLAEQSLLESVRLGTASLGQRSAEVLLWRTYLGRLYCQRGDTIKGITELQAVIGLQRKIPGHVGLTRSRLLLANAYLSNHERRSAAEVLDSVERDLAASESPELGTLVRYERLRGQLAEGVDIESELRWKKQAYSHALILGGPGCVLAISCRNLLEKFARKHGQVIDLDLDAGMPDKR